MQCMLFMWVTCKGVHGLKFYILLIWTSLHGLNITKYLIICLEEITHIQIKTMINIDYLQPIIGR